MNAPHTELAVADASRLVERLGADTHPLQQYRELTTNALEAVAQADGARRVTWDVDWYHLNATGGQERKLSITDTGLGMTAEQMRQLINHLAASGDYKGKGTSQNFGVGAKIAAGMRNPAGLEYASFPAGHEHGARVRFGRSPDGRWGLLPIMLDGVPGWHEQLDTKRRDAAGVGPHGTVVTLMGDTHATDTTKAPSGAEGRDWWLLRYLNARYVDLPPDVELLVRPVCRTTGPDDPRTPELHPVRGMRSLLNDTSRTSGVIELPAIADAPAARVHWWILDDDVATRRRQSYAWPSSGHMAAIMCGEAYETLPSTRGGYQRLQEFGIRFAYERVVLYVEPDLADYRVIANTARTRLLCAGEDLPWDAWARAFRAALPDDIARLQEHAASQTVTHDRRETIARRMSAHPGVYALPAYRPPASVRAPRAQRAGEQEPSARRVGAPPTASSARASSSSDRTPVTSEEAEVAPWERLPSCRWVTIADGTRAHGDLEDRAGRYDADTDTLTINGDYRPICALISHFTELHGDTPGSRTVIETTVREWCETALCEAVIAHRVLQSSVAWPAEDARRLVDEIGLSAALAPVVAMTHHIARTLAQRLGKP
ncbi:MAG: sensor histidine kinase [Solirubrobacteraceae bacterium]|nr:sensor histidine kinase [Solirubrobacteraceae bacterium]